MLNEVNNEAANGVNYMAAGGKLLCVQDKIPHKDKHSLTSLVGHKNLPGSPFSPQDPPSHLILSILDIFVSLLIDDAI